LVPIFGFTKEIIKKDNPKINMTNFKMDLNVEEFGANLSNNNDLENCRCALFFQ
jgi:hypothetical protein